VTPLLCCSDARLSGAALSLGTLEARGPRLMLVGAWGPLFEAFAGRRRVSDGQLLVAGLPAEGAAASGHLGLMLRDAPLPPTWTLEEVLVQSAELLGGGWRQARQRVQHVLSSLELGGLAGTRLGRLRPGERRAAGVACAALGEPRALALEEPLSGLEPAAQSYVAEVLERALAGRAALLSVPELPGGPSEDALAARSDELLVLSGARLVVRGTYRELAAHTRGYRVIVLRSVEALLSRLGQAGYEVRRMLTADVTTLWVVDPRGLGTVPLFEAALAADAPIIELVSVGPRGSAAPPGDSASPSA
jgi:ABC-2 type transport system ATP-binding protein